MKSLFDVLPKFPEEYQFDMFSHIHFFENIYSAYENLKSITSDILIRDANRNNWIYNAIQNLNDSEADLINQYEIEWYNFHHETAKKEDLIKSFKNTIVSKVIDSKGCIIDQEPNYIHTIYFKASNNQFLSNYSMKVKHQDICNFIVKGM